MRERNPLLKKSKTYIEHLLFLISISFLLVAAVIVIALVIAGTIHIKDSIMNVIYCILGVLIPIEKSAIEKLFDATPWETHLSSLFRKGIIKKDDLIRISFAACMLIEVDGEYLLVKNSHGIGLFQLPSRTYPLTYEESKELEIKYNALRDNAIPHKFYDYRLLIPAKKIKPFYRDFCSTVNPYTYDYRPILCDVARRCSLDDSFSSDGRISFRDRIVRKIEFSRYTDQYEMIVLDVCLLIPTETQLAALRTLKSVSTEEYRFADLTIIKNNGVEKEKGKLFADIGPYVYDTILPRKD